MSVDFILQLEYLGRLCIAGVCGLLIGYERINRGKEAGVRTHFIVALASALIMEVSKYGFYDMTGLEGVALDPSRVAAQIVTGIGFLGAGIIFVRNQTVSGLTTAAGVWGTAGIGMAVGAGMYTVGVMGTLLIVVAQIILHKNFRCLHMPPQEHLRVEIEAGSNGLAFLTATLIENNITVLSVRVEEVGGCRIGVDINARLPRKFTMAQLLQLLANNPHIKAIEL